MHCRYRAICECWAVPAQDADMHAPVTCPGACDPSWTALSAGNAVDAFGRSVGRPWLRWLPAAGRAPAGRTPAAQRIPRRNIAFTIPRPAPAGRTPAAPRPLPSRQLWLRAHPPPLPAAGAAGALPCLRSTRRALVARTMSIPRFFPCGGWGEGVEGECRRRPESRIFYHRVYNVCAVR